MIPLQERESPATRGSRLGRFIVQRTDFGWVRASENHQTGLLDIAGVFFLDRLHALVDRLDVFDVVRGALVARGDDEAFAHALARLRVHESPKALVLAEAAPRGLVSGRGELKGLGGCHANKRGLLVRDDPRSFKRSPDGAALSRELVHSDVAFGDLGFDEVVLGFDGGKVVLSAALEHEVRAKPAEIGLRHHVQPDVLGQDLGESRHDLFLLPALLLEIDDVRFHEHRAAVPEHRDLLRLERHVGVFLDLIAESRGGALQEVAVAGGALGVELEVLDLPVLQHDDLDVLTANVNDNVNVFVVVQGGLRMRNCFDERHIGFKRLRKQILGVTGRSDALDFERGALAFHVLSELLQQILRVQKRVAFRQLVGFGQQGPGLVHEHGLGGGRAAVDPDERFHGLARREGRRQPWLLGESLLEVRELLRRLPQSHVARRLPHLRPSDLDEVVQRVRAGVQPHVRLFAFAVDGRPDRTVVFGVLRYKHQVSGIDAFGDVNSPLFPDFGDVFLPAVPQTRDERVGTAEEQDGGTERVPSGQHAEVLLDDGLEKGSHQLIGHHALLLQTVDVGLGEDAAFTRHRVDLDAAKGQRCKIVAAEPELAADLVDYGARSASAFVVHTRHFSLCAGFGIGEPDDDLGVLAAELDHGPDIRV